MKILLITTLFKKGYINDMNKYRPIFLLSELTTILETIIANRFLYRIYILLTNIIYYMPNNMVLLEILELRKHYMLTTIY